MSPRKVLTIVMGGFFALVASFSSDPEVLVMVMVGAVIALVILLPLAAEVGKRAPSASSSHVSPTIGPRYEGREDSCLPWSEGTEASQRWNTVLVESGRKPDVR